MSNMETLEAISADYIKRSDALEEIHGLVDTMSVCVSMDECNGMRSMKERALTAIGKIEPADVQPVVRGKWVWEEPNSANRFRGCFLCNYCFESVYVKKNFCPNCGARMDGVE